MTNDYEEWADRVRGLGSEPTSREELSRGKTTITLIGAPRRVPEVGERVEDGSWRGGFRAIGEPTSDGGYPGESREPAGAPWPLEQMAAVGE